MNNFYEEFKDCNKAALNECFIIACQRGDIDRIDYLINSSELRFNANPHYKSDLALNVALSNNKIEVIKYLFNPKKIKKPIDLKEYAAGLLYMACREKDYEWLEELLPIAINYRNYSVSALANECCHCGNFEVTKYLLNSPIWGDKITIDNGLFNSACSGGNPELIDYLLKSEWKDKFDIHDDHDLPFINCCESLSLEAVKYFIFDLNIEKSSDIDEHLNYETDEFQKDVIELFNKRELNNSLTSSLTKKSNQKRKNKI